jgi:putative transposase
MKKTRFTESQIVAALKKQQSGVPTKEVCREMGFPMPLFMPGEASTGVWKPLTSGS